MKRRFSPQRLPGDGTRAFAGADWPDNGAAGRCGEAAEAFTLTGAPSLVFPTRARRSVLCCSALVLDRTTRQPGGDTDSGTPRPVTSRVRWGTSSIPGSLPSLGRPAPGSRNPIVHASFASTGAGAGQALGGLGWLAAPRSRRSRHGASPLRHVHLGENSSRIVKSQSLLSVLKPHPTHKSRART